MNTHDEHLANIATQLDALAAWKAERDIQARVQSVYTSNKLQTVCVRYQLVGGTVDCFDVYTVHQFRRGERISVEQTDRGVTLRSR